MEQTLVYPPFSPYNSFVLQALSPLPCGSHYIRYGIIGSLLGYLLDNMPHNVTLYIISS